MLINAQISQLTSYSAPGRTDEALRRFEEMTTKGLQPDEVTYNTVIRALCRAGRLKALDGILERMRRF